MSEFLQRLSIMTGQEYGLLEALVNVNVIERTQLLQWVHQIVDDRLALAEAYLVHAQSCDLTNDAECRQIISRAYYAAHHAARAFLFEAQRRDIATHDGVVAGIGQILGEDVMRTLRRLHRLRNQVEYELYLPWLNLPAEAAASLQQAQDILIQCRTDITKRR